MTNSIDKYLDQREKDLQAARHSWEADKPVLLPIVNGLEELGIESNYSSNYLNIPFTGDKHKLAAVVRMLRKRGFKTLKKPPQANDTDWYTFYQGHNLTIWLHFTSAVCRRIKIGTTLVPQDVYETVCGESNPQDNQSFIDTVSHTE